MMEESPFAVVSRIITRETGVAPKNTFVMELIDAVRRTSPPPREVTIGMLSRILRSLEPTPALDDWAVGSAREIVGILSRHLDIHSVENLPCALEGTISGMLKRVCSGMDLDGD